MINLSKMAKTWTRIDPRFLPFADVATPDLPLSRLLRLSLFQVSVGMATALLVGTLNRVMIVELHMDAWMVALMVALPLIFAPFRALIGHKSDTHRSILGWRRVPYIWIGTWLQFGGLAIMPFALIILSGDTHWPAWFSYLGSALAFLLVGAGMQTTQTAGLALATDLADAKNRPRVVAMMYVMLLFGMVLSGVMFSVFLDPFSPIQLIKVIQGVALITLLLNLFALWKQEARQPKNTAPSIVQPKFSQSWSEFIKAPQVRRFLIMLGLGTTAFSMQDIILEPYGGEILLLDVSATSFLTALIACGSLLAFTLSARWLSKGYNAYRIAASGLLLGLIAFSMVIFSEPLGSPNLFRLGALLIGFGGGLFAVSTLTIAMSMDQENKTGMVIGAWGAVTATCSGIGMSLGGVIRDLVSDLAMGGVIGTTLMNPATGYSFVYHIEIYLLFITLIALGPLVAKKRNLDISKMSKFGLADFPS
ncbi:Arabinose efflux permease [Polynucleobacter duraquae]|jgi:BCD family chlorophyll transporter-like MFS transporter|uniref:Arabinose efflux permease n=1 Tax=Polynucleobacter duraquae TaxID=1835254 RepID=A0A0E3ZMD5_9BURK|nr:BCD family MFS transporter [Polynucleobacter duraquae]AKD25670.1 Arabinose efflux permease [Polynucleobacter duraquae]